MLLFNILLLYNLFSDFLFSFASVATSTAYKVKDSVKETVEKQVCVWLSRFFNLITQLFYYYYYYYHYYYYYYYYDYDYEYDFDYLLLIIIIIIIIILLIVLFSSLSEI